MSLSSLAQNRGLTGLAGLSQKKNDLTTLQGLSALAQQSGLGKEAKVITDPTPKLSVLQRLTTGLSAFNPAEAILVARKKAEDIRATNPQVSHLGDIPNVLLTGAGEYLKNIGTGLGSAISGTDYQQSRRSFKDVAEKMGVKNNIAKFGIGFLGDVMLDPTTYFGAAITKGIVGAVKGTGSVVFKGVEKVAPDVATGINLINTGLQDALGKAFKYGYKTSGGATDDVLTFLSKEQRARLGLASSNLDRLGTGVLTQAQREELALKLAAGKRAEFIAREAGQTAPGEIARATALKGTSPEVAKTIEAQIIRSKKFAQGVTENPYETYFPFLKNDKVKNFLNETKGIQVGSEGYTKQFKNILTNDAIELDPAKAFFTRESQIVSDRMTRDFLNGFVGKYGKALNEFKNSDEAAKAGFQLIKEKGIFGKAVGYANEFDAKLLRDSISPEFQTINMLAKATGFDAVTSLFKRSVTGLFASFHIRNYVSGHIQNFETLGVDALNPRNVNIGSKIAYYMGKGSEIPNGMKPITVVGKTMKFQDVMKPFVNRFSGDTFYNSEFEMALKSGNEMKSVAGIFSKQRLKETIKTAGLGTEAIPFKVGRAIGQFIEHQQKATAYITALGQGKKISEALNLAEKAGFDYRALTRFESQIMRRIIPFYSFTRKNIGLQLATLGENPQRINQVLRFFGNIGESIDQQEKQKLPDFIKESIGIKLQDTPEGLKQYISSFGTPIEGFTQLFGSNPILRAISQMNPILKVPVEIGIGKDSFRQRDLKDVYDAKEYEMAPKIIKDLLEIKEVKKDILKRTLSGKLTKVGIRTQYVADPIRLLIARSLFTSRGVSYLDQVFGGDLKGFVKLLKVTTGLQPQTKDIESQTAFRQKEQKRALEDLLQKTGKIKVFQRSYIPK